MHNRIDWKSRVREAFAGHALPDDDVLDELAEHAQAIYETARTHGFAHDEANERVAQHIESWRSNAPDLRRLPRRRTTAPPPPASSSSITAGLAQDFCYAARLLRRQPRYALLAILTMALGVGATTVLFSVTYGVLMKPLPWPNSDRIVALKETRGGRSPRFGSFSNAVYLAWREEMTYIDDLAAWSQRDVTLSGIGDPERIRVVSATASLFPVLGVRPLLGSVFGPDDETERVLVLSESLWRERFGANPQVIGTSAQLDGQAYTIIGILQDTLAFPDRRPRAWIPTRIRPSTGNSLSMFNAVAVLRPGATISQASAEGTTRGRFVPDTGMTTTAIFGGVGPVEVSARLLRDTMASDVRGPLFVLLAAVGLLFVTSTANIASLQLARATTRKREMAIRRALGAAGTRIGRQLLVENLMLGLIGGFAGLVFTWWLHTMMPSLLPIDFPRIDDLKVNGTIVLFAVAASLAASVICGLLPALYVQRLSLAESLGEDGAAALGPNRRSRIAFARMFVMAGQIAVACVLLVGASLLARSFLALLTLDRGYDPSGVLTARLSFPDSLYTPERRFAVVDDLLRRLSIVPGVTDVSFTSELPLTPGGSTAAMTISAPGADGGRITAQASPRIVSPRYFAAIRMRIIQGRSFVDADVQTSPPVAIVNRTFARRYLNDNALGTIVPMAVGFGNFELPATLIGVVDDAVYVSPTEPTQPEIYYSYLQLRGTLIFPVVNLVIHTADNPTKFVPELRASVRASDNTVVPDAISTMEDRVSSGLARPRLYAVLLGGFAMFAVVIAGVGLFGILSYLVIQRSRELALRTALGACRLDLVTQVLRQGFVVAGMGLIAGLVCSTAVVRSIGTMLYGVTPYDPFTFLLVPLFLLLVAAIACFVPALRASRTDPIRLLKS
jgi:putative ABC transport system permease protein